MSSASIRMMLGLVEDSGGSDKLLLLSAGEERSAHVSAKYSRRTLSFNPQVVGSIPNRVHLTR